MPLHFMDGGGAMGAAIRAFDWTATSLGSPVHWSPTLKTAVALVLDSRFPKCIVWGPERICIYNDAFLPILGDKPEALGRPFGEVWAEAWDTIGPIADMAFQGKATFLEDMQLTINRRGYPEEAWFTFCYSPIRDEFGRVVGMMDTVMETTGKVLVERQSQLLNDELAHRIKNMLAVIQSITDQTFHSAENMDAARQALNYRLAALGGAHEILTKANWTGATVDEVVKSALAPHVINPQIVDIEGPHVPLDRERVLPLALALHELATNAIKHGALSIETGRIRVNWTADTGCPSNEFRLTWQESGGPEVRTPARKGFGSKLITRLLPRDFGGKVTVDYAPGGLFFELRSPLDRLNKPA